MLHKSPWKIVTVQGGGGVDETYIGGVNKRHTCGQNGPQSGEGELCVYVYIYVCVCVCVCARGKGG